MTVLQKKACEMIDLLPDDCVEVVIQVMNKMLPQIEAQSKVYEEETISEKEQWQSPLGIKTDEQLWEHIDRSLAQAKAGIGQDADDTVYVTDIFHGLENFESKLK